MSASKLPASSNGSRRGGLLQRAGQTPNGKSRPAAPVKAAASPLTRECGQAPASANSWPPAVSTDRQVMIRRRSRGVPLKLAVRSAVDAYFHFSFRTVQGEALWSATERVWLGRRTFLHWALWLADFDIPWAVSTAVGAPHAVEQLRGEVFAELVSYWVEQVAALPRRKKPGWLPLP